MLAFTLGVFHVSQGEERLDVAQDLMQAAAKNEQALRDLVPRCDVEHIAVFAEDMAPVGGARISRLLNQRKWPQVTDVVLDLSANTVAVHRANIMNALGIHKTAELVVYAIRAGLVNVP